MSPPVGPSSSAGTQEIEKLQASAEALTPPLLVDSMSVDEKFINPPPPTVESSILTSKVSSIGKKRYLTRSKGTAPPFSKKIKKGNSLY